MVYKKIIYFCCFLYCSIFQVVTAQNAANITLRISEATEPNVSLERITDQITKKTDKKTFVIAKGSMEASFQINEPTTIMLSYGLETFELFVNPGDNILATFEGARFLKTLYFSGQGSIHNNYLKSFRQTFLETNDNVVTYKINSMLPIEFKQWMTEWYEKRIAFFATYNNDEKQQFSTVFKYFAFANIDYWYGSHLLRYKSEHVSASVFSEDIDIPFHYYDFLNKLFINNDKAISSRYYRDFLEYYLPFRTENLGSPYGLANEQIVFEYQGIGTPLMNMPFAKKSIGMVQKNTRLLYLNDKMTYTNGLGEDIAYRIKVRTDDGQEGWMRSNATQVIKADSFNCSPTYIEKVGWSNKMAINIGVVKQQDLRLLFDPFMNSVVTTLKAKDTVFYMNQRTTELLPYRHDSTLLFTEQYYKVRTTNGKIGWVSGGCFTRMEKEMNIIHSKERIKPSTISVFREIDRYFSGKSRAYLVAKDIARRVHFEHPDSIRTQYNAFMADPRAVEYHASVQTVFLDAQQHPSDINTLATVNYVVESTKTIVHNAKAIWFKLDPKTESLNTEPMEAATPKITEVQPIQPTQAAKNQAFDFKNIDFKTIKTVIKGNILEATGEKLTLKVFADKTSNNAEDFQLTVTNGAYAQDIEISQPVTATLSYGSTTFELFIEPGDDISISFNANTPLKNTRFSGKGAVHCQYLKENKQKFETIEVALKNNIHFSNPSEFKVFMADAVKQMQQYYSNYPAIAFFSDGFKNYATANYNYWFAFNMLNYPWEHPLYYGETEPMELSPFYYDFLQQIPINNDQALGNKYYNYFVDQYISNQKRKPENKGLTQAQLAAKFLSGRTRECYETKLWLQAVNNGLNETQKADFQTFMTTVADPILLNVIKKSYFKSTQITTNSPFPNLSLTDNTGKIVQLEDFKGKVIYVDLWATWCIPCLTSIKKSQALKTRYREDEVVFLYISVDWNRAVWQQYLTEHPLAGTQVFGEIDVVEKATIKDVFQINLLPVFFVVDKTGHLASDPKERPDNEQVASLIQKLLAK